MRLTRLAGVALVVLVLLAGCGGRDPGQKSKPQDQRAAALAALKVYLTAFQKGQADKACALESPDYAQAQVKDAIARKLIGQSATCEDLVTTAIAAAKELGADFGAVSRTELKVVESSEDHVNVRVTYPDAPVTSAETYTLVPADGGWLVDSKLATAGSP